MQLKPYKYVYEYRRVFLEGKMERADKQDTQL